MRKPNVPKFGQVSQSFCDFCKVWFCTEAWIVLDHWNHATHLAATVSHDHVDRKQIDMPFCCFSRHNLLETFQARGSILIVPLEGQSLKKKGSRPIWGELLMEVLWTATLLCCRIFLVSSDYVEAQNSGVSLKVVPGHFWISSVFNVRTALSFWETSVMLMMQIAL